LPECYDAALQFGQILTLEMFLLAQSQGILLEIRNFSV
jgi:hypothetical protein